MSEQQVSDSKKSGSCNIFSNTLQPLKRKTVSAGFFPPGSTNSWSLKDGRSKRSKISSTTTLESDTTNGCAISSSSDEASHVNVASGPSVPKALKACRNCRKSKLKCESRDKAKCKRCTEQGIDCVYEIKVPSPAGTVPDAQWMTNIENKLYSFENTLGTILSLLKTQPIDFSSSSSSFQGEPKKISFYEDKRTSQLQNMDMKKELQTSISSDAISSKDIPNFMESSSQNKALEEFSDDWLSNPILPEESFDNLFDSFETETSMHSMQPVDSGCTTVDDASGDSRLRNIISFFEAKELFRFFNEKISPHLFGYPISHVDLPVVWSRSPILVAAICTVAAIHHQTLNKLAQPLRAVLNSFSQEIIFKTMKNESEAIDTVIALCVAGFWLPDSSMLTSLALRLAKNLGLNTPLDRSDGSLNENKNKLRLWYLLYILDGHQSLISNQTSLLDNEDDAIKNSRGYLLSRYSSSSNGDSMKGLLSQSLIVDEEQRKSLGDPGSTLLSDMRLVSQVEFNQAVNSIFQGRGWDLLTPSNIGVPWQTNIELDKWMVSWACLLTPVDGFLGSWPSKSTLIHYNFAKMHINCNAIRDLQKMISLGKNNELVKSGNMSQLSLESNDGGSGTIAVSAAQNVLNLSTTDRDILSALQYVPVHVHMMLYYAALLLLNSVTPTTPSQTCRSNLGLVRSLRSAFISCMTNEQQLLSQIVDSLRVEMTSKIKQIQSTSHSDDLYEDKPARRPQTTIAGWPGSISSHSR